MTSDIVERLRQKVFHGPTMQATHLKTIEWQAADEIERLRAALKYARYTLCEARLYKGYEGGPLFTPFAEMAEHMACAALHEEEIKNKDTDK